MYKYYNLENSLFSVHKSVKIFLTADSIHVKAMLPHTVGTHEVEHTFVVWAEDSCYNRVTGTVTITTYNVVSYHRYIGRELFITQVHCNTEYKYQLDSALFGSCNENVQKLNVKQTTNNQMAENCHSGQCHAREEKMKVLIK